MKKAAPEIEKIDNPGPPEPLVPTEPAALTPGQIDELKARAAKADEHWERLVRTTADFDNFKKRAAREKQESLKYANETLMEKLVTVLDNLDMAISAAQNGSGDAASPLRTGIAMVQQQFKNILAEAGLEEVDAAGRKFDPHCHDAVSEKETTEAPEGQVLQQLRKGYKLRDRLLRPASVVVAKKPAETPK
jgi:molecular chaperone GrpE